MTRARGELPEPEELLLGIERPTLEQEAEEKKSTAEKIAVRQAFLRTLMENPLFREWFMEQLIALDTFVHAFGHGPTGFPDPMATQYKMGMKAAGWHLWTLFDDVAPDLTSLMRRDSLRPKA